MDEKTEMNPTDAAKFYKVSRSTIYKWMNSGLLKIKITANGKTLVLVENDGEKPDESKENGQPVAQNIQIQPHKNKTATKPDRQAMFKLLEIQDILIRLRDIFAEREDWFRRVVPSWGHKDAYILECAPLEDYQWLLENYKNAVVYVKEMIDSLTLDASWLQFLNHLLMHSRDKYEWYYPAIADNDIRKKPAVEASGTIKYWSDNKPEQIKTALNLTRAVLASMVSEPKQPLRTSVRPPPRDEQVDTAFVVQGQEGE